MSGQGLFPVVCVVCALLLIVAGGWLRFSLWPAPADTPPACLRSAREAERGGDRWAAVQRLTQGIRRWPTDVPLRLARASLLTELDHRLGSYQDYSQVLLAEPRCVEALLGRARLRLRGLDTEGALADVERAARVAPGSRRCRELLLLVRKHLVHQDA